MTALKTDMALLEKLRKAATQSLTSEELHKQKVSFIMGSVDEESGVTREYVEKVLAEQAGTKD